MLTSHRCAATLAVAAALTAVTTNPALADEDPVVVERSQFGWIDTEVIDIGSPAKAKEPRPPGERTQPACTQSKSPSAGGYASEEQFDSGAPPGGEAGGWVVRRCADGTIDTAWVPVVAPGTLQVSAVELAQRATNRLPLPLPEPMFEPRRQSSAGPTTLVAIPTWFFLDGWRPVRQRTKAGATWAEVSAEPVATTWWPGDGSGPVQCAGAGRAWSATDATASPCTYTYTRSSAAQPDNAYTARVVVTWRVTWRGSGGAAGTLPLMERQSTFSVAVAERQTVIVGGGRS